MAITISIELLISVFLAIIMFASLVSLRAKVPYTLVLVFFGMAITAVSLAGHQIPTIIQSVKSSIFDPFTSQSGSSLFVGLIVPPLIFEAMMHTKSTDLRSVIRPSVVLATVGVVIATIVGGLVLWKIVGVPATTSFLFAAAIAPTDAATVLEIFRRTKVPSKLATLMDVEAAFNDATGIMIFSIVLESLVVPKVSLLATTFKFVEIFGGGVVVGLLVSFIAELLASLITEKLSETLLTISAVYGSYALASTFGFSGLIAVSVAGLYFGNLTIRSAMGPATREAVTLFWQIAAFLSNSIAFLFIGFSTNFFEFASSIYQIIAAFLAVTAARVASVYPILTLFNRFGREKIPMKWRNVATLGGMRGALSIALAASIPASYVSPSTTNTIHTLVLGVAFISISLQAAALFRYVRTSFPEEQRSEVEELDVRLRRSIAAIEYLQKLKEEGKISGDDFASQLERDKDELTEVLNQISSAVGTTEILRSRAAGLYSTLVTLPMSKAMQVLRINRMEKPIQTIIEKTTTTPSPSDGGNGKMEEETKQHDEESPSTKENNSSTF